MKTVEVKAKFPEIIVDGYAVEIAVPAQASNIKAAVSRAVGLILKSKQLARKRIKSFTLEVTVQD